MDNYKLTYFNLRGIAEPIRLLFKYVNVPFEDNQIDAKNWVNIQKNFKWQQVPILEYNGKILTQSGAIGNFLAAKFNLVPKDPWNQAKCEEIHGAIHDLRLHIKPLILAKITGDTDRANELKPQLLKEKVPLFFANLNELLEEFRCEDDSDNRTDLILGGKTPTWTDFCLAHYTDQFTTTVFEEPTLLDEYPLLKKQQVALYGLSGVAEWICQRPQTDI